eukprot:16443837-Heterocapsa_arctica.AAC.1
MGHKAMGQPLLLKVLLRSRNGMYCNVYVGAIESTCPASVMHCNSKSSALHCTACAALHMCCTASVLHLQFAP